MIRVLNVSEVITGSGKNSSGSTTLRYLAIVVLKIENVTPTLFHGHRARLQEDRAGGNYSTRTYQCYGSVVCYLPTLEASPDPNFSCEKLVAVRIRYLYLFVAGC
jgi:hypothetical protein